MTTFAELLTTKTQQDAFDELLAALQDSGFPTTSWSTVSVPRRLLWATAGVYSTLTTIISNMAAGGLIRHANKEWLTLLADDAYDEQRAKAAFTQITVTIGDPNGVGPYTVAVGQLWFSTNSGKRFLNTTGGTLGKNGTLEMTVQAEASGAAYNVGEGEIVNLNTALPGVGFARHTAVKSSGTNPPAITVSGTPVVEADWEVEILTAGGLGAATFKYRKNAELWSSEYLTAAAYTLEPGVVVSFPDQYYEVDNAYKWTSGASSFNPTPDYIVQVGVNEQSDDALREACRNKWATLGFGANNDWYEYQITHEPTFGATITRVLIETNPGSVPGLVGIWIATVTGAPPAQAVSTIQDYLDARKPNVVTVQVQSASNNVVDVTATLYVRAGTAKEVEAANKAKAGLRAYFETLDIGGTVYLDQIKDALIYDSAVVRNLEITEPTADVSVTAHQIGVPGTVSVTIVTV